MVLYVQSAITVISRRETHREMETERQRETETEREREREKQRVSNVMFYAQSTITIISGRETETVTERQKETEIERHTERERERETHGKRESDRQRWRGSQCGSKAKHWVFHGTLSFTKLTSASSGICRQG